MRSLKTDQRFWQDVVCIDQSWGCTSPSGVESLIEHRASVEGPDTQTPQNLIRVSAGLEHTDDLIANFKQALGGKRRIKRDKIPYNFNLGHSKTIS